MILTREKLLDFAEDRICARGYHAVSFREIADELGIKSSSVHYHFRYKHDLGAELLTRYQKTFFYELDHRCAKLKASKQRLAAYCGYYRDHVVERNRLALCGILGAEALGLPIDMSVLLRQFFEMQIAWLMKNVCGDMSGKKSRRTALFILSTMQGGMMIAINGDDIDILDQVIKQLLKSC